jgi:ABC-type multidrug transport system ATPase subunit/ABC-type multidrug transport system permease subunit
LLVLDFTFYGSAGSIMLIDAVNISKTYPSDGMLSPFGARPPAPALDGANLKLTPGIITGLTGPNGAGKSTLLRILSGRLIPDGGTVKLDGIKADDSALRASAAMAETGAGSFYLRLTAMENLFFFGAIHGHTRAQTLSRTEILMELLGIREEDLEKRFDKLSEGAAQKFSLARALMRRAPALLLDEPAQNLDLRSSEAFHGFIKKLAADEGTAVLYISHNPGELASVCGRVLVMEKGRLIQPPPASLIPSASGGASGLPGGPPTGLPESPTKFSWRQIFAFLRRDFLIEKSYKLSFALSAVSTFTGMAVFFFIDKLFGRTMTPYLAEYGAGYFSYVFAASAFFGYIGAGAGSYAERLRAEQLQGTLEASLSAPVPPAVFLTALTAWNFLFATFELCLYALAGIYFFKMDFSGANPPVLAAVFFLSAVSFAALGIFSSCFILLFKRGNPAAWVLNNFEGLLGGVYFPVAVLPPGLLFFSKFLPVTYSIRAMELALYKGAGFAELKSELSALALFAVILAPLSVAAFKTSLKKARRDGSLGQY